MPGVFENAGYVSDSGQFAYGVRYQPETLTLSISGIQNALQRSQYIGLPRIRCSGSRRRSDPVARRVVIQFTGAVPSGYAPGGIHTLPWFNRDNFAGLAVNSSGTYVDSPIILLRKILEKVP